MSPRSRDNYGLYSDFNFNLVYGCRKVDKDGGCKYCYIDRYSSLKERTNLGTSRSSAFAAFERYHSKTRGLEATQLAKAECFSRLEY